jgi:hypothetical protein
MSTHLTNSEKKRFKLKNKDGRYISDQSTTNKTNSEYVVVGTPPERALEQEKIRQMTKIIEEKIESNMIDNRNINDIYDEYNNNKSIDNSDVEDEKFFSCNSENSKKILKSIDNIIDNSETTPIHIPKHNKYVPSYSGRVQNEWLSNNDKPNKNQYDEKNSFDFSELFESNSLSNNLNNCQPNNKNKLLTEFSTYQSNYYDRKTDDVFEFSTSLISTEKSLIIENSEAYVIIDHHHKIKPIMRSDQHEYRKRKVNKVNKFIKSSYGFLKGSLDYIGSYGNSM